MLSILILSQRGEGKEIADKLITEGHIVKFWTEQAGERTPNIYPWQTVDRYQNALEAADLCLFTSSGLGRIASEVRARGKMVVGGELQDLLVRGAVLYTTALSLLGLEEAPAGVDGVRLTSIALYDGKTFVSYLSQPYVRLLENDRGPKVEMGCILQASDELLARLEPIVSTSEYRGMLRLDLLLCEEQVYATNIRLDFPGAELPALCELCGCSLGSLLVSIARGTLSPKSRVITALALTLLGMDEEAEFKPPQEALKHCWRAYSSPLLGYITASGQAHREARRRLYRTTANSVNPAVVYRRDIGCNSVFEGEEDEAKPRRDVEQRTERVDSRISDYGEDRKGETVSLDAGS